MNFNLGSLRKYFGVNKKEAAAFILMLLHLEEGEEFNSVIGKVRKLKGEKFEVVVGDNVLKILIDYCRECDKDPTDDLFK